MEPISILTNITSLLKTCFSSILKKCGYKIVPKNNHTDETVKIDNVETLPAYAEEHKKGAQFYWSENDMRTHGYEIYFDYQGNDRRSFKRDKQLLWIKRK